MLIQQIGLMLTFPYYTRAQWAKGGGKCLAMFIASAVAFGPVGTLLGGCLMMAYLGQWLAFEESGGHRRRSIAANSEVSFG